MSNGSSIPPTVIRRLTKYLTYVQDLRVGRVQWVSSLELGETLGVTSSTVRQDLSHLDFSGTSKRGYDTEGLERVLTGVLGADRVWNLVVVGAGNLGRALALHNEFPRRGFHIQGIFDADREVVGQTLGHLSVQPMAALPAMVTAKGVAIGVIAVPSAAAQSVADLLIASGIKGLLNLTLTHIVAPKRVAVIDTRIVASLLELSHAIKFSL